MSSSIQDDEVIKTRLIHSKSAKRIRDWRRSMGLCIYCGIPNRNMPHLACANCLDKRREQNKNRRMKYKQNKICTNCANPIDTNSKTLCNECLKKYREYNSKQRQKKKGETNG